MKQIKIVTAVERTLVSSLSGMKMVSKTEAVLSSGIEWQPLTIKPHAQLTVSDKVEDKNTVWTAKLVFKACGEFGDRGPWAYRCRLKDGSYRLIGSGGRPYPVTTVTENMPENISDNQLCEVTVTWQSPHFVPYIGQ